ncbi:hypothetical protein E0K83_10715 [Gramella sp. BOM4]|nr:hypothetical protein [Christiangramia bathymodioli]
MKTNFKNALYLGLCFFLAGCSSDDDQVAGPGENPTENQIVKLRFDDDFEIRENDPETEINIHFDQKAVVDGEIEIRLHLPEDVAVQTTPAAENDRLKLSIEKGDESISFKIKPTNDELLKGHKTISFSFGTMSQGFQKADNNGMELEILDDELEGKPKGYKGPGIDFKYFYQEDGKIKQVIRSFVDGSSVSSLYTYNEDGKIANIVTENGFDAGTRTDYFWEEGKIVRSEEYFEDVMTTYSLYDYDEAGNIGGKETYTSNESGEFIRQFVTIYLYFNTGNLYKQLIYYVPADDEELELISTRTFDNYLDKPNLFPVYEVIPGIMTQNNLPGLYRVEENGMDLSFEFTYEYNEAGNAVKRITEGEEITYEYY